MGDPGDREVKKIPYGIADYEAIRKGNYYYVDKTSFLREIEGVGKYLFFIRPRRFGKSLFLSLMETYLSTTGTREYEHLTHGEGFFRAFFNVLKAGTTGSDAPISRLFLTGVSPITLDDVTSGFNIGENISLDPGYNQMLGFTRGDVEIMIDYYRDAGWLHHDPSLLLELLEGWYGNYRFSKTAEIRMYNADMVLYFLKEYFKIASIPDELVDNNARIDYRKLRHLMIVDRQGSRETNGNFSVLRGIVKDGEIVSRLVKGFPVARLTDTQRDHKETIL